MGSCAAASQAATYRWSSIDQVISQSSDLINFQFANIDNYCALIIFKVLTLFRNILKF